jgi:thymidylate kinase
MKRHPIIAIEGIDGSGKSTVANLIAVKIGGVCIHTPDEGYDAMKDYFKNCCESAVPRFYFYLSSIWDAYQKAVKITENKPVVLDRYSFSTLVYHKVLFKKCGIEINIDKIAESLFPPAADLNIYLKVNDEVAVNRLRKRQNRKFDTELECNRIFQSRVSELFTGYCPLIVDANTDDIDLISENCIKIIKKLIPEIKNVYA